MNARIVIVGAGPVGLSLALGLAHHGVASMVLEHEDGVPPRPGGVAIWPRTLELLADWGAAQPLRAAGAFQRTLDVHEALTQHRLISIDFTSIADILDAPGSLIVREDDVLRILRECIERTGLCEIRRGVRVLGVTQAGDDVTIDAIERGALIKVTAPYVAGCDGAQSTVRLSTGLALAGIVAGGAVLREELPGEAYPEKQTIRVSVDAPGLLAGLRVVPGAWQRAQRYIAGRVALAGDAAHLVAPSSGEGLNSGIHDAANLAWKLAYAALGRGSPAALLESYDCERVQATVALADRISDRLCRSFTDSPPWMRPIGFALLSKALAPHGMQRKLSRALGMLSGRYTESPIVDSAHPMSGRRIDNLMLASGKRLHDERNGRAAVVAIGNAETGNHARINVTQPPKRWCVKAPALAVVRPDGVVASVIEKPTPERLEAAWRDAFAIEHKDALI